jgi:protein-S-isoprenylcysteine O-methyltransferase Ste14
MTTSAVRTAALWTRGLVFTALVPLVIAAWVPAIVDPFRRMPGGAWHAGWPPVGCGAAIYTACLSRFLASGGTPAIFFTRPVRAVIGEEPDQLVQGWLYSVSRNPMYLAVVLSVVGQAIVYASRATAVYAVVLWLCFHFIVVVLEEPHLHDRYGSSFDDYCRRVPRWL